MKMIGNVSDWLSYAGGALIKVQLYMYREIAESSADA